MNLQKAIVLSKEASESLKAHKFPNHADAVQLGIEALKLIQRERLLSINPVETQLPGETED